MPALDQITIQPKDMINILDKLQQLKYDGPIRIIDTLQSYTIRDISEGFLTEVKKDDEEVWDGS